jgi:hypothetical protein
LRQSTIKKFWDLQSFWCRILKLANTLISHCLYTWSHHKM